MLRLLRTYLARVRPLLLGVLAFQSAQAVFTLLLPRITAELIDRGVIAGDRSEIWSMGALMLGITLGQVGCMVAGVHFAARSSMRVGREMRTDLFHQVTGFSAREVGHFGAPTLITRITNDVQQVQTMVQMACTMAVVAPLTGVFGTIMAVREDAQLSLVLLVAIPILVVIVGGIMAKVHPIFTAMQDLLDDVNTVLREQITGIRVVRAFVREPAERERFGRANDALTGTGLRSGHMFAVLFPLVMLVQNGASVAIVWFGAARIDSGEMTVGSLVAFLGYIVLVLMSVMMASFMFIMLPRAAVSGGRIMEALDAESSVVAPTHPVTDVPRLGTLELRDVSFGYPGAEEPVVDRVSFTARPGQTTAIIGSTGSGKTTLLGLVPRLFDVTAGAVVVDGFDVREMALDDLWSRIGFVPQKPFLFSGTVADNLRYGKADATEDEMWEALTVAQGADFVRAMPDGLDSAIAQGGTNVSGGQRQRLAIARALVRKPEIFLFDDSFSALDLATDARLRAALVPHTAGATFVIVAQRVSTIIDADQIVVLEAGRVVGLGTHSELLDTCATYVEIVESQLSAEEVQ
ncbi:MAG: ABC transporter ATP-binding protein [Acidimicrobiia bacterium]|nr:ABC transporter ATP-binding protein [Acidimicrobiia bacterium]